MAPSRVRVAAGILRDHADRILIAERVEDSAFVGLWEFPGGKLRVGESAAEALQRELREELGIEITDPVPFMDLQHDYPDRLVSIDFFLLAHWRGNPRGLQGQRLRWCRAETIGVDEMLPADAPVLNALVALKGS